MNSSHIEEEFDVIPFSFIDRQGPYSKILKFQIFLINLQELLKLNFLKEM